MKISKALFLKQYFLINIKSISENDFISQESKSSLKSYPDTGFLIIKFEVFLNWYGTIDICDPMFGSNDYTIRKWNLSNYTCENVMETNQGIQSILLPMTNDFLLSAGYDGRIKIWNNNAVKVKSYYYQHGSITTGTLLPGQKELEKNTFIFGDHLGEIFIKQFIFGESYVNKYKDYKFEQEITSNNINDIKSIFLGDIKTKEDLKKGIILSNSIELDKTGEKVRRKDNLELPELLFLEKKRKKGFY